MPNLTHKISHEGVAALRSQVETYVDRRIVTPADYDYLSRAIREQVRQSVSATTLKRIWGYIRDTGDEYMPGRYTMCALARFIGFRDYEDFVDAYNSGKVQSLAYRGETVMSADLPQGAVIEVCWAPGRRIHLTALGGNTFRVLEAVNAKIIANDVVECASFTQNAPLYFNRVLRHGEAPMSYVAGSRSGIRFRQL